jgi:asparagine synthetase A
MHFMNLWVSDTLHQTLKLDCRTPRKYYSVHIVEDKSFHNQFSALNKSLERFPPSVAAAQLSHVETGMTVNTLLSDQCAHTQELARNTHVYIITSLRYLTRQTLALRGHEHDDGNDFKMLQLRRDDNDGISGVG